MKTKQRMTIREIDDELLIQKVDRRIRTLVELPTEHEEFALEEERKLQRDTADFARFMDLSSAIGVALTQIWLFVWMISGMLLAPLIVIAVSAFSMILSLTHRFHKAHTEPTAIRSIKGCIIDLCWMFSVGLSLYYPPFVFLTLICVIIRITYENYSK